jgi:hypothetical protein
MKGGVGGEGRIEGRRMVAVVAARRFCAVAVFRGFCGKKGRDEGASCICGVAE